MVLLVRLLNYSHHIDFNGLKKKLEMFHKEYFIHEDTCSDQLGPLRPNFNPKVILFHCYWKALYVLSTHLPDQSYA